MKLKLYSLLFVLFTYASHAQITIPTFQANFGVDADLRANFFKGAAITNTDDWFIKSTVGASGSGVGIIDTTGAAAILNGYNANVNNRKLSFYKPMAYMPYTVVNNKLLLDALFYRDFHGDDSTVFAQGSNKNGMTPADWSCPVAQNIPDKNDILDANTHLRRDGTNITDSLWMFGGISIENTTGNRYFDFELYQTDFVYNRNTRTFSGYGGDAGHTAWLFDAAGNVLRAGDIIFSAEYSSSSLTLLEARIWVKKSTMQTVTPANFSWGGLFDGASSSAVYGYASIKPKTAGTFYTGLQSAAGVWPGPFQLIRQDNSIAGSYIERQYMEFSVNLSKLGLDPALYGTNPCTPPYKRLLIKSRASTSFTAELKDFVMPFKMFDRLSVDAYTEQAYQCKFFYNTYLTVRNPDINAVYTWSTSNGIIIGSNIGTGILAGAPGTYRVLKQLNTVCPQYAQDSVTLKFDRLCPLLNVSLQNLQVYNLQNSIQLSWNITNNENADEFTIEQSSDAVHFSDAGTVSSTKIAGNAAYFFNTTLPVANTNIVYYRIKITSASGEINYSQAVSLMLTDNNNKTTFYPNPAVNGQFWFVKQMQADEIITLSVWNCQGKQVATQKINVVKGLNKISANFIAGYPEGYYFIKVQAAGNVTTGKILVTK